MGRIQTVTVRNTVLGDGTPKICVPITARSRKEMEEQVERLLTVPCDMAEWRADFFEETDNEKWLIQTLEFLRGALGERPLLFTFRTKEEGGERGISMKEYERLNMAAAATGLIDLADVELNRGEGLFCSVTARLHGYGVRAIGSFHDFAGTPAKKEITDILCRMQSCGADITKAAVMPRSEEDVLTLLDASLQMKKQYGDRPYITMSMGSLGAVSRLAGSLTGSAVTFAAAGRASAPGQMEAEALARLLPALNVGICR